MNVGNISTVHRYTHAYARARKNFANTANIIREIMFIDAKQKDFNCVSTLDKIFAPKDTDLTSV